jgi:(p)ppGpp synthase/HD superfamily hydrolase
MVNRRESVELISPALDRALRRAAEWHKDQSRKSSGAPYVEHVMAVALVLDRLGFGEEVVIAGLLHDAIEDTGATRAQIEAEFGPRVADLVQHCSEVKLDEQGKKRPWIDRKRDHLAALATAPLEARAIVLADKLHNLVSIQIDLSDGKTVWETFRAERADVLSYYRNTIEVIGIEDPRLELLAEECREILTRLK